MGKFDDFLSEFDDDEYEDIFSDSSLIDESPRLYEDRQEERRRARQSNNTRRESYDRNHIDRRMDERRAAQQRSSDRRRTTEHRDPYARPVDQRRTTQRRDGYAADRQRPRTPYNRDSFERSVNGRQPAPRAGGRPVRDPYQDNPDYRRTQGYRPVPDQRRPVKRKKNGRKIIMLTSVILVLVLLTTLIAVAVSSSGSGEVSALKTAEVAANQVVLSWEKADKADGYRVLMAKNGSDDFEECQTINDPDTTSAAISDLEQATAYSFGVAVLRGGKAGKTAVLSDITTLPDTPAITNSFSSKPGTAHIDWSQNDKANGYVVEYKKEGGEYRSDAAVTVSDPAQCRADITDLEVNATYLFRVYAFVSADKQLNSAPSAEASVKVVAEETEVVPKAPEIETDSTIDPDKPMIALTFDDGPAVNTDSSDRILDVLEKNGAKASFFMVGYYVTENPDNVKRKANLKMELGNHTWDHSHYGDEVAPDDIRRASNAVYDICGQYPTCFRSPGGMTTNGILEECKTEGMSAYYWSIDTQDWSSRDADAVYHSVMDNVKDGDIILMHEIYDSTADAVERMVPELIAQGYQLVTCHDLIAYKTGADPEPGVQYVDAYRTFSP